MQPTRCLYLSLSFIIHIVCGTVGLQPCIAPCQPNKACQLQKIKKRLGKQQQQGNMQIRYWVSGSTSIIGLKMHVNSDVSLPQLCKMYLLEIHTQFKMQCNIYQYTHNFFYKQEYRDCSDSYFVFMTAPFLRRGGFDTRFHLFSSRSF